MKEKSKLQQIPAEKAGPSPTEAVTKKIFSLLGLAKKAGFVQSGEFLAEKAVKGFGAYIVIVAGDASDNTKKKFRDMCAFYKVPCYEFGDKDSLGHALGNELRASVAVRNAGMAKKLKELLDSMGTGSESAAGADDTRS